MMGNKSTTGYSRLQHNNSNMSGVTIGQDKKTSKQLLQVKANGEVNGPAKVLISQVSTQPIGEQKSEDTHTLERRLHDLKIKVLAQEAKCQLLHSLMKKQEEAIVKINKDNAHLHKRLGELNPLTNLQMAASGPGPSEREANKLVHDLIDLGPVSTIDVDVNKGLEFELVNPINDNLLVPKAPFETNSSLVKDSINDHLTPDAPIKADCSQVVNDLIGALILIFLIAILIVFRL